MLALSIGGCSHSGALECPRLKSKMSVTLWIIFSKSSELVIHQSCVCQIKQQVICGPGCNPQFCPTAWQPDSCDGTPLHVRHA